jgi:hypothetical protein
LVKKYSDIRTIHPDIASYIQDISIAICKSLPHTPSLSPENQNILKNILSTVTPEEWNISPTLSFYSHAYKRSQETLNMEFFLMHMWHKFPKYIGTVPEMDIKDKESGLE